MLDRLSGKLGDLIRQIGGKAHISEKNIQDAINEIKIALLEADVSLRVVRRFVNQATEEALGEKVLRSVTPGPAVRQDPVRQDGGAARRGEPGAGAQGAGHAVGDPARGAPGLGEDHHRGEAGAAPEAEGEEAPPRGGGPGPSRRRGAARRPRREGRSRGAPRGGERPGPSRGRARWRGRSASSSTW